MKKSVALLLSVFIIIPALIALAADGYTPPGDIITKEEAYQFADELKQMDMDSYEADLRLIVKAHKQIDYLDAVSTASGINDLYVLQFDNEKSAQKAENYYNSLSYVEYVERDMELKNAFCSVDESDFDFPAECISTVNHNIDDAIKLLKKENIDAPEIKIAVLDSGIARTEITQSRIDGGYTFVEGVNPDGTTDLGSVNEGHGSKTAGTIILNTLDNVRLYSYQVDSKENGANSMYALSSIYMAAAEGCKIINMSLAFYDESIGAYEHVYNTWNEAIDYATSQGCICVAAAGNDGEDTAQLKIFPAQTENSITVGALNNFNSKAWFSNFGEWVDIYTIGGTMTSYDENGYKVTNWAGTSAATPVMSAICALLVQAKPDITVDEIKQLLLETGSPTNEENQNDPNRIVADAYGCVKKLLGAKLETLNIEYTVTENSETGFANVSFKCDDENARLYYNLKRTMDGSNVTKPYNETILYQSYEYKPGTEIILTEIQSITVYAYAPGKEKNFQYLKAPDFNQESGYLLIEASATRQYNAVNHCNLLASKTIEVPGYIDGVEIQEIGNYCFMGNQAVETIILPESVKQIDNYAFTNCPNLKTVIALGVERCDRFAFYRCNNLVNVEMPNITVANTAMFKDCPKLETAKLGTLTEIDNHAFYGCENLKLVKTTNDDIAFAERTFYNCNDLTIYTPERDTSIYTLAKQNDIPVILSFNYSFSGAEKGTLSYTDQELGDTVTYQARHVARMWDNTCLNQKPDYDELGFLFEIQKDGVLNAKDFALINYNL